MFWTISLVAFNSSFPRH